MNLNGATASSSTAHPILDMRFGTAAAAGLRKIAPNMSGFHADPRVVEPTSVVCDLRVMTDDELTMRKHATHTAADVYNF